MLKMVIVGTAHMHANEIALYIHEHPECELRGVADLVPEQDEQTKARYTRAWNLQNIAAQYGAKIFDDYRAMLDEVKPDLTFILCENDRKVECALECAKRKLNFSIEKPMALTLEQAKVIADAVEKAGVEAMVNWPVVWRPYVNRFMNALQADICGKPIKLEYQNGHTGPLGKGAQHRGVSEKAEEMDDATRSRTWWYQQKHGGGIFLDIMCYGSLYSCWTLGADWQSITAMGLNLATPCCDCEDNAAAIVSYGDRFAMLGGTWTTPNRFMPTGPAVICENGVLYCTRDEAGTPTVRAMDIYGNDIAVPEYAQPAELTNLVWNYANHVKTGAPLHTPVQLGMNLQIMSLLTAFIDSAREHREVRA